MGGGGHGLRGAVAVLGGPDRAWAAGAVAGRPPPPGAGPGRIGAIRLDSNDWG